MNGVIDSFVQDNDIKCIMTYPGKFFTCILLPHLLSGTAVYTTEKRTTLIAKKVCTHYCVSEFQCSMLSYQVNGGVCKLHKENCVVMVQATDQVFNYIMLYRQQKHGCVSWLPYLGNITDGKRLVHMNGGFIMVRIHYNNEILPGRLKKGQKVKTVGLVNGPVKVTKKADYTVEFLVVSETCSVSWVP